MVITADDNRDDHDRGKQVPNDPNHKNGDDKTKARIPTFRAGGVVKETGIALVHEGEFIVPATGSEAIIEPVDRDERGEINYHFPVQIEIVGSLSDEEREAIEEGVWAKLMAALERLS